MTLIHGLLILSLLVLPLAYGALSGRMRARLPNPPARAFFFIFGTVGGTLLIAALSPSGISATMMVIFFPCAFVSLVWSMLHCINARPNSRFHKAGAGLSGLLLLIMLSPVIFGVLGPAVGFEATGR